MEAILFMGAALVVLGVFAMHFARTQARTAFERGVASTAEERAALAERVAARDSAIAQLTLRLDDATQAQAAQDTELRALAQSHAALAKELDAERKAGRGTGAGAGGFAREGEGSACQPGRTCGRECQAVRGG